MQLMKEVPLPKTAGTARFNRVRTRPAEVVDKYACLATPAVRQQGSFLLQGARGNAGHILETIPPTARNK